VESGTAINMQTDKIPETAGGTAPGNLEIGILAIQGDFQAHGQALQRMGQAFRLVRKAEELCGLAGLILPGGESTTLLKFLREESLFEPIRQFAQAHPVFGTCAGAILMADRVENPEQESLRLMRMTVRRNAYGRQLASSIQTLEASPGLDEGPEKGTLLEAVLIRAPVIVEVGPEVEVLARLEGRPVLVRQGLHLAGTFHPELTSDMRVHRYFCGIAQQRPAAARPGLSDRPEIGY
jgi:5'-phosphate synthase pdxT subunit